MRWLPVSATKTVPSSCTEAPAGDENRTSGGAAGGADWAPASCAGGAAASAASATSAASAAAPASSGGGTRRRRGTAGRRAGRLQVRRAGLPPVVSECVTFYRHRAGVADRSMARHGMTPTRWRPAVCSRGRGRPRLQGPAPPSLRGRRVLHTVQQRGRGWRRRDGWRGAGDRAGRAAGGAPAADAPAPAIRRHFGRARSAIEWSDHSRIPARAPRARVTPSLNARGAYSLRHLCV